MILIPLNGWRVGKKEYNLSMNTYRNLHYYISNKLKKLVSEHLLQYRFKEYNIVHIEYIVYFKDKRKRDLLNFVSVVDKFVLDHLVTIGSIKDDNYKYVTGYTVNFGGMRKENVIEMNIKEID